MNFALINANKTENTSRDIKGVDNTNISKYQFEELKKETIKETLCQIFEEKGYPKLPQCYIRVKLPSLVKKDVVSKLSHNLRGTSFLNILEKSPYPISNVHIATTRSPIRNYSHTRYEFILYFRKCLIKILGILLHKILQKLDIT